MSNFDALMFTLFAVAVLTTLLRLFIRGSVLRTIGLDDVLAVLATVGFLSCTCWAANV